MVSRRRVAISFGAVVLTAPLTLFSQQRPAKIPRVGYLQPVVPENGSSPFLEDFRQGLRELGYVEGRNLQLEIRWGEGKLDRLPALAEELVRLKVDVIMAVTSPSVVAAKQATGTIPIVMPFSSDPVGDGLVTSLARPGGNITGLSMMAPELGAKRLQLLKEVFPKIFRPVAVVWNPDYVGMMARFRETQGAAPVVGMGVRSVEVRDSRELERALESMERERPDAIVLLADPLTVSQRLRIVEYAAAERVPAIYEISQFVDAGGLMSYGPNVDELVRRAAIYVDKILKGAKPADLPIEQPTKFEFVINLKCAKALGVTIPQTVLLQADRVIE
ncbi:MAG TPA: ABC transporter substrate-binding protein [Casimicrobiaceae bacterium]|jgi:putative ABC transport system substrate-binding protein|nr:ABC transporter substrate-binding protein [Casimicrobiaceae bacterium]